MSNFSKTTVFFTVYGATGPYNVVLLALICVVYLSIIAVNLLLVLVICLESSLHRPMYVLLAHLALNGVASSSTVSLNIMKNLLMEKPEASLQSCLTQVFFSHIYCCSMYSTLALMAYDRYVSICRPLQYHCIMTAARVRLMLATVYGVTGCAVALQVYLMSRMQLCGRSVDKLLCDIQSLVNLSCQRNTAIAAYNLTLIHIMIMVPFLLVLLSYVHIVTVMLRRSKASQSKALETCTPHLLTFINFSIASFLVIISNRINLKLSKEVNIFVSISFTFIPPLVHPLIYGIKTREIRKSIRKIIRIKQLPF